MKKNNHTNGCCQCGQNQNEKEFICHMQKAGLAMYDNRGENFLFLPDRPVEGCTKPYRKAGVAQMLSDGTFDFVSQPRLRAKSTLIRKLAHGRVSHTVDNAVQLTLKVYCDEGVNIAQTIAREAFEGEDAIIDWQLKRQAKRAFTER